MLEYIKENDDTAQLMFVPTDKYITIFQEQKSYKKHMVKISLKKNYFLFDKK
jgi:hypothetical protein